MTGCGEAAQAVNFSCLAGSLCRLCRRSGQSFGGEEAGAKRAVLLP
ncbi:MAG: hypothetical protein ACLR2G_12385 [Phascolarctobacterium faecium]